MSKKPFTLGTLYLLCAALPVFGQSASQESKPMRYIDAHLHIWTDDTDRYPLGPGYTKADMKPARFTPEDLFQHAKPLGVTRFNLVQMSYYLPRDLSGKTNDGFDNSYMLEAIQRYPKVFVGTAVINPHGPAPARQMKELGEKGVRAFRIHPRLSQQPPATWLRPPGYAKMFEAAARHKQALSCLIDPDGLAEVDRMCAAYPNTVVIIDHLARIGADGQIRAEDVTALCQLARRPNVYVKVGAFYALGKKQPPYTDLKPLIQSVVKAFGPQRCMWESDSPFQVQSPHTYAASLDLVQTHLDFLSADDKEWLLWRTAEKLFFPEQK